MHFIPVFVQHCCTDGNEESSRELQRRIPDWQEMKQQLDVC